MYELRRAAGADEVTKTELANRIGVSRQTVSKRFRCGDMKLSEFVASAMSLNKNPAELLQQAVKQEEASGTADASE